MSQFPAATAMINYIANSSDTVKIDGGDGKDTIYSDLGGSKESGSNIKIFGGAGNDYIGSNAYNSTIDGGAGNDYIYSYGWNVSLSGGAGNDYISNYHLYHDEGFNVTINGGVGDDTIYLGSSTKHNLIQYAEGGSNDTIYYAKSDDTIQIATNSGYASLKSGNDLIINVGEGSMTFKYAANLPLNIVTEDYEGEP